MIDNAFELVTQTMERQYPDHVAFRYVAADGKTLSRTYNTDGLRATMP